MDFEKQEAENNKELRKILDRVLSKHRRTQEPATVAELRARLCHMQKSCRDIETLIDDYATEIGKRSSDAKGQTIRTEIHIPAELSTALLHFSQMHSQENQ